MDDLWISLCCVQVLRGAGQRGPLRVAGRHHQVADLSKAEGPGQHAKRGRAHGVRGNRPPLLHRHPRPVPDHNQGVLRLRQGSLPRGGRALLSGKDCVCWEVHRLLTFLQPFFSATVLIWVGFLYERRVRLAALPTARPARPVLQDLDIALLTRRVRNTFHNTNIAHESFYSGSSTWWSRWRSSSGWCGTSRRWRAPSGLAWFISAPGWSETSPLPSSSPTVRRSAQPGPTSAC